MNKKYKIAFVVMMYLAVLFATYLFLDTNSIAVLDPKGLIAVKEKRLLVIATYLMLIVVIPVFVLTFVVAWKYRADNKKSCKPLQKYTVNQIQESPKPIKFV